MNAKFTLESRARTFLVALFLPAALLFALSPIYAQGVGGGQPGIATGGIAVQINQNGSFLYRQAGGTLTFNCRTGITCVHSGQTISIDGPDVGSILLQDLSGVLTNSQLGTGINATHIGNGAVSNTEFQYLDGVAGSLANAVETITAGTGIIVSGTGHTRTVSVDTATVVDLTTSQTLTNKILTTPTIASFTNAPHDHSNSAGGGTIAAAGLPTNNRDSVLGITIDGGGSAITTGIKGYVQVPFTCTIQSNTVLADQPGSIVIDVWKDTYANAPPTVADTITASAKPTLSSAAKSTDSTLTGWTTSVTAGDVFGFKVDSATTVTLVTLEMPCRR